MAKQFRSVLCGIGRDEDRYLPEWVAYHLALGFDHVFLYDNMSRRPSAEVVPPRDFGDRLTVIRWPGIPGHHLDAQLSAYEHFLHTYRDAAEWGAVLDLDEFLNLKQDDTVGSFLDRFPTADAVAVNWRMFGSSGELEYRPAPLMERFRKAAALDFHSNIQVKTIYRLDRVSQINHHAGSYQHEPEIRAPDGRKVPNSPYAPLDASGFAVAQVNHYFLKSREEWVWKNERGYADGTKRDEQVFIDQDRNEEEDLTILRRLPAMLAQMPQKSRPTARAPEIPMYRDHPSAAEMMRTAEEFCAPLGVSSEIHDNDMLFGFEFRGAKEEDKPTSALRYLQGGRATAHILRDALHHHRPSRSDFRLLDFASGYGRVSRFMKEAMPDCQPTACDIHAEAVEFIQQRLGLPAFQSATKPEDFTAPGQFDVIFCLSFFTHMPKRTFAAWLSKLGGHLAPGGLLVFTTHGLRTWLEMGRPTLDHEGFRFTTDTEQYDLNTADYGNNVSLFDYVYRQIQGTGLILEGYRGPGIGIQDMFFLRYHD